MRQARFKRNRGVYKCHTFLRVLVVLRKCIKPVICGHKDTFADSDGNEHLVTGYDQII